METFVCLGRGECRRWALQNESKERYLSSKKSSRGYRRKGQGKYRKNEREGFWQSHRLIADSEVLEGAELVSRAP
jgi:hypothetical protein